MKLVLAQELKIYQNVLSDLIQRQIMMLGPNVALSQARKVTGFKVNDKGEVTEISSNPQQILSQVANQYMELSEAIASMTLTSITAKYPDIKIK